MCQKDRPWTIKTICVSKTRKLATKTMQKHVEKKGKETFISKRLSKMSLANFAFSDAQADSSESVSSL